MSASGSYLPCITALMQDSAIRGSGAMRLGQSCGGCAWESAKRGIHGKVLPQRLPGCRFCAAARASPRSRGALQLCAFCAWQARCTEAVRGSADAEFKGRKPLLASPMTVSVAVTTDCDSMEPPAGTIKSCKVSAVKFDRALTHRLRLTQKVLPA